MFGPQKHGLFALISQILSRAGSDNLQMTQGKRTSTDIAPQALQAIREMGAAARTARIAAGESQATTAARLGVHVQTIGRIESGEPGVAVGHVLGMLALYGIVMTVQKQGVHAAAG